MYNSVKGWCNVELQHKQMVAMSGAGDRTYSDPKTILCYLEGKIEMVKNLDGDQVITTRRVYVDGDTAKTFWPLRVGDGLEGVGQDLLKVDGKYLPVQAIEYFYDGAGRLDLAVIYV